MRQHLISIVLLVVIVLVWSPTTLFAQEESAGDSPDTDTEATETTDQESESSSGPAINLGFSLTLGVTSFEDDDGGTVSTYQLLALRPELILGKFGLGLDLPVNYRFTGGDDRDEFEVREEDWVPDDDTSFLELYLPKFRYIRYGRKGDDLYALLGGVGGATIGNGFIVNGYTNELYLPDRRIFGAVFDVDRALAGVRYFGIETLVSNVAAWDVMAARLYVRPLAGTSLPIIPDLQLGVTVAVDRDPFYYAVRDPDSDLYQAEETPDKQPLVWGIDVRQPIISRQALSLAAFGDVVFQEERTGAMVGVGGHAFRFLLYGAQLRVTQDNFVPEYFDGTYDRRRLDRLAVFDEAVHVDGGAGWLARLGFSILGNGLVFDAVVSGPFSTDSTAYPELRSSLTLAEGIVPGFEGVSAEASYTKFDLREFDDLVDAEDAIIGSRVNIRSGPVIISLLYDLIYDPEATGGDPWTVRSGLETTISF
jgi:hypothetical protein